MRCVYTIGYAGVELEEFINILKKHDISCIVDVRSNPNSKYFIDFNMDHIKSVLNEHGILYRNYQDEFGARQENPSYHEKGYLDFERFACSDIFNSGVRKIEKGMEMGYIFALMCAEKDPATCHRSILVARAFHNRGYDVKHILSNGGIENHTDLEKRLVEEYFPDRMQVNFLANEKTYCQMVEESYLKRNQAIGYRLKTEEILD